MTISIKCTRLIVNKFDRCISFQCPFLPSRYEYIPVANKYLISVVVLPVKFTKDLSGNEVMFTNEIIYFVFVNISLAQSRRTVVRPCCLDLVSYLTSNTYLFIYRYSYIVSLLIILQIYCMYDIVTQFTKICKFAYIQLYEKHLRGTIRTNCSYTIIQQCWK